MGKHVLFIAAASELVNIENMEDVKTLNDLVDLSKSDNFEDSDVNSLSLFN